MQIDWKIVDSLEDFEAIVADWGTKLALDTETHPSCLLGVSMSPIIDLNGSKKHSNQVKAIYIPVAHWDRELGAFKRKISPILENCLKVWLQDKELVGHNFTYDKQQILKYLNIDTRWVADTRIMWHLASAPAGPRPYGLKDAQVDLLGWDARGDVELKDNVKKYGGSLRKGEHYLADIEILAKYAALDAYATAHVFNTLSPFFSTHDYWPMLCTMMEYNELLEKNTREGVLVDRVGLQKSHDRLLKVKEAAKKRFHKELSHEIESLEKDWADRRVAEYKREHNKTWYASHPEEWKRFNINSDSDKRELFFEKLKYAPSSYTESGKACVDGDSIKRLKGDFVESYLKYEHVNTITSNFSTAYLNSSLATGRLHPGFNICGTVSYRLSGFKPYLLNAPFDEKEIMRHLQVDPGNGGVHADLSAIEPTITAHYSEDSSLFKVFGQGLGDIYLDLALELFPNDKELQDGYCSSIPITRDVKEKFARQRKVSKIIQLAVQYTGTGHTVSKNLTKEGIPTTVEEATNYVRAYWKKFRKVAEFNYRLRELNRKQGYLRNVIGRIIRVPDPEYKDLSNRFIQSSAHDVLVLWVLEIYRLSRENGVAVKPILLDCHDSTSNQCPVGQVSVLKEIYKGALNNICKQLELSVKIKADIKEFKSLAGLKGEE